MIDINEIFSDSDKRIALWCDGVADTADLATIAENIIINDVHLISVMPDMVPGLWVYLEKTPVKIFARYDFYSNQIDAEINELVQNITQVSKHGANGVQIFLKMNNFDAFVDKILPVQPDLFFEKDLSVAMDISDVDINHWDNIFEKLNTVGAKSLMLTMGEDAGKHSDFVGRIYGMLKNWDFDGELHFMLDNNFDRIDQVIRLIESEKPELHDRVRFFLNY